MKKIVIIGANIAGLNCALNLNTKKFSVVVVDKSKNPGLKPCAGGVSAKCDPYIPKKFYKRSFNRFLLFYGKSKLIIDRKHRPLHTIDRTGYLNYLMEKCKKNGVKVILGKEIKKEDIHFDYIIFDGKKANYDILIGADGYDSVVRKKLRIKSKHYMIIEAKTKKRFDDMQVIVDPNLIGYFWIFPHKGYSSVGCGTKVSMFRGFCKRLKIDYYEPEGCKFQYCYKGYKFGNKYLIGEAGGFVSKLTGEGIYHAIISGREIAYEINTGKKSKELRRFLRKLKKQTLFTGAIILFIVTMFIKTKLGRKLIEKICEKLSVK